MRLSGIGARQNDGRTLGPHPEGPPQAGVSKDGREQGRATARLFQSHEFRHRMNFRIRTIICGDQRCVRRKCVKT
jgi:hypothetical protein